MKDFNETLKSIIVEKIAFACYVPKGSGAPKHKNRPFHGFVIAGEDFCHTYTFSDGKSIYVKPNDLFYLPKNSNYIQHRQGCIEKERVSGHKPKKCPYKPERQKYNYRR